MQPSERTKVARLTFAFSFVQFVCSAASAGFPFITDCLETGDNQLTIGTLFAMFPATGLAAAASTGFILQYIPAMFVLSGGLVLLSVTTIGFGVFEKHIVWLFIMR
eukprot:766879_1